MFTNKAKEQADACRFCWMCRHICPVALVTGLEGNTPRGKGLLVSMDSRGIPITEETAEVMFQCALCGACTNDCATAYDPRIFIREARTEAVVNGIVPPHVQKVIDRAMDGTFHPKDETLSSAVEALPKKADVLLFLGETGWAEGKSALALMDILKKAGVSFTVLKNEPSCGAVLGDLIGYVDEVKTAAEMCFAAMAASGAKKAVFLDPFCLSFIRHQCAEWDILPDMELLTATAYCAELIRSGKLVPETIGLDATFHDPCHLSRDLDETGAAREILAALGIRLKEMFLHGRMSKCCGGPVMRETNPQITRKMAAAIWYDAAFVGAETMITACPGCSRILGESVPEGCRQEDLFVLLAAACR